jgi:hypothetical protein
MREIPHLTDRKHAMARLARKLAWGKDAIFHGTRYANETLRSGKSGAVLVLNRRSLCQRYRLEPYRYDDDEDDRDEREERIYGRLSASGGTS